MTENAASSNTAEHQVAQAVLIASGQPPIARYDIMAVLLHWLYAMIFVAQLGLGWYVNHIPASASIRASLFQLHLFLGLVSLALVVFFLGWRAFHAAPALPRAIPLWQRILSDTINALLYLAMLLTPVSGYLVTVFNTESPTLWSVPLPVWGAPDAILEDFFKLVHFGSAWSLAVFVLVHLVIIAIYNRKHPGMLTRMSISWRRQKQIGALSEKRPLEYPLNEGRKLARHFRTFGWLAFLLQSILALVGFLLLLMIASGSYTGADHVVNPSIFWARLAMNLLVFTILAFFYCARIAKGMAQTPDLSLYRRRMVRIPAILIFSGFIGMVSGTIGIVSSVALLIAKTISQPPGIAITDPSKIVRALDVFILLANLDGVVAHIIGTVLALWLSNRAVRCAKRGNPAPSGTALKPQDKPA